MPFKYAVEQKTVPVPDEDEDSYSYSKTPDARVYPFILKGRDDLKLEEVPKEVAENADPEHRTYRQMVTVEGKPLTDWIPLYSRQQDISDIVRKSQFAAQPDFMGTMLKTGDYVLVHIKGYAELQTCKVVGFVKQEKIRIQPLLRTGGASTLLRFSTEVVKIPDTLLGENPEDDWYEELQTPDFGF